MRFFESEYGHFFMHIHSELRLPFKQSTAHSRISKRQCETQRSALLHFVRTTAHSLDTLTELLAITRGRKLHPLALVFSRPKSGAR